MAETSMAKLSPTFDPDRWVPPPDRVDSYRMSEFMRAVGITDLQELAARAAAEPEWYYPRALDFVGATWLRDPHTVVDESDGKPFAHWFVGGGTNLAWFACERWTGRNRPAL